MIGKKERKHKATIIAVWQGSDYYFDWCRFSQITKPVGLSTIHITILKLHTQIKRIRFAVQQRNYSVDKYTFNTASDTEQV